MAYSNRLILFFLAITALSSSAMDNNFSPKVIQVLGKDDDFFLKNFGIPKIYSPSKDTMVVAIGKEVMIVANADCATHKKHDTLFSFVPFVNDMVKDAVFSPNGQKIIATSRRGTVRIWDREGNLLHEIIDKNDSIHLATFGESDGVVITNSLSNINKIWQLPEENPNPNKILIEKNMKFLKTNKRLPEREGGTYLVGADLSNTISTREFQSTDLKSANLTDANLSDSSFTFTDFTGADLTNANLTRGHFPFAQFKGAILKGANLTGADLRMSNPTWSLELLRSQGAVWDPENPPQVGDSNKIRDRKVSRL